MRGAVSQSAKVVGGAYQAATKDPLPEPVDVNTSGQRVAWVDKKTRQLQPATSRPVTRPVGLPTPEDLEELMDEAAYEKFIEELK